MNNFEFKVFWIILICHETGDDALEEFFVYPAGVDMVDDCLHALHEVIGVQIVAVMNEKPDAYGQCYSLIGILEVMSGA